MWKSLTVDGRKLNSTIEVLHQAAQFVAMMGNSYLPEQPDEIHKIILPGIQKPINWKDVG